MNSKPDNENAPMTLRIMISDPRQWSPDEIISYSTELAIVLIKSVNPVEVRLNGTGHAFQFVELTDDGRLLIRPGFSNEFQSMDMVVEQGFVTELPDGRVEVHIDPMWGEGLHRKVVCPNGRDAVVELCRTYWLRTRMCLDQAVPP